MDENNDGITDSTDARFEFEVRQAVEQLQRIQGEINALMVQARLYSGATSVVDQARAFQIEGMLRVLRNEQTLVENHHQNIGLFGSGFGAGAASSGGSFMGTGATPGNAAASSSSGGVFPPNFCGTSLFGGLPGNAAASTPGLFGAAYDTSTVTYEEVN